MEKANVTLDISCLVTCPRCEDIFDLFEMEDLIEDGYLYDELLPKNKAWGKENWGEIVKCPECKEKITIELVEW